MTSKLDELFSPDRLRQNWQVKTTPIIEPSCIESNLDIHTEYHKLRQLIGEKIQDISCLSGRFDELTEKISHAFPLDITLHPGDAKQKEAIVVLLEQLETLLWAMELSQGETK